jgi:hypothetical protein
MLIAMLFSVLALIGHARADPILFPIVYTTSASPPSVKSAVLTYDPAPPANAPPSAAVSAPTLVATLPVGYGGGAPGPADGILVAPDGAYYAASAAANLHRVQTSPTTKVTFTIVSPANPAPPTPPPPALIGSLRLDPGQASVWAIGRGSGGGRISRTPISPSLALGTTYALSGHDTIIHDVCFVSGRTYYIAPGNGGSLGLLNTSTFTTTRLLSGLAAAAPAADPNARTATITCDPLTGHLLIFGNDRITQLDISGQSPAIISEKLLGPLLPGVSLRAGTPDGQGRLIALSATGHLVLIDYSSSRRVGASGNIVRVLAFDPAGANLVPISGPGSLHTSDKIWDSGAFDLRNGQYSQLSPTSGDGRAADDFALGAGQMHRIDTIRATMFTNSTRPAARIELYEDCNGRPGALVGSWAASLAPTGQTFAGFAVYDLSVSTPNLWLDGGRDGKVYWVCPVGVVEAASPAQWYWCTANSGNIVGSPGAFKGQTLGFPNWTSVANMPCGCTDFAFRVEGQACKVAFDNGQPTPIALPPVGSPALVNTTLSSVRTADDLVVLSASDLLVCYLRAVVYSNCADIVGSFDLYPTRCKIPDGSGPMFSSPFSRATDLGQTVVYDGQTLRAYLVEAFDLSWYLPGNSGYALSVTLHGSGSLHERALWAYADDCVRPGCARRFNEASVRIGTAAWQPISRTSISPGAPMDMSFLVAGSFVPRCPGAASGTGTPTRTCLGDFNGSGDVNADDLFEFLDAWFAGCP